MLLLLLLLLLLSLFVHLLQSFDPGPSGASLVECR